jgi:hypothetical protein
MEETTIPETDIDEVTLEQINDYVFWFIDKIVKYGNYIPGSSREDYIKQITKDFQEWYGKYPDTHYIECVNRARALAFCIPKEEEEKEEYIPIHQDNNRVKLRTTLDDDSESEYDDHRQDNEPDDYYQ